MMKKKSKKTLSHAVRQDESQDSGLPVLSPEEMLQRAEWSNRMQSRINEFPFEVLPFQAMPIHTYAGWYM